MSPVGTLDSFLHCLNVGVVMEEGGILGLFFRGWWKDWAPKQEGFELPKTSLLEFSEISPG